MEEEEVVMTPSKKGKTTVIRIEKVKKSNLDQTQVAHVAGGHHSGLVINKQIAGENGDDCPHLQLEFKCFLVDQKTGKHIPESRTLKFWFAFDTVYLDKVTSAYEFFKELVRPDQFPRDYIGFIKKVMKQLQNPRYMLIQRTDVDLRQLDDAELTAAPGLPVEDKRPRELIVQEQLLHYLESAYPNVLPTDELAEVLHADKGMVCEQLKILIGRNLIKEMEPDKWVRNVLDKTTEVKIVKQMPAQAAGKKPTVAIITSRYYEKLAVDAMMEDKTTFVKYKTEGESNVYTIGFIGAHKVVSTKLPAVGRQMAAQISSGNTTTRLLGTFNDVEHVLLVGVCGGVPHYTDFYSHTRLGDVVISAPNGRGQVFVYCDKVTEDAAHGRLQYSLKSWTPGSEILLDAARALVDRAGAEAKYPPWEEYVAAGAQSLSDQEVGFDRPSADTDRLFMNVGGDDVIEVAHPPVPPDAPPPRPDCPTVRFGALASGKPIAMGDQMRLEFAARHQCIGVDTEFDQVLESIVGNRQDSFLFVRGVADYLDGSKNAEWQPYAALLAAAFVKALLERLPAN